MPGGVRSLGPDLPVIEVVIEGSLSDPATMDLLLAGLRELRSTGYVLSLVDAERLTQRLGTSVIIDVADRLREAGLPDGWRQAVLRPHDLDAGMAADLWEAAANNRGLSVKVFRDRALAMEWLLPE